MLLTQQFTRKYDLQVEGITFGYHPEQPVVKQITSGAPSGAITALLGPNGAGKSTLLHLLLGLYRPWEGRILLGGKPLAAYSRAALSRVVGLVPQREHFPFAFRVREYLLLGRSPYLGLLRQPGQEEEAHVDAALARVGISHLAAREVASLSGGEHQLVLIARALVQGAPVMLLDEPTAHLDMGNKYRVLDLLKTLAAEGRTLLFSTHDPQAAADVADYIWLLKSGELRFVGASAEALTSARLSALYGIPLAVAMVGSRPVVLRAPAEGAEATVVH